MNKSPATAATTADTEIADRITTRLNELDISRISLAEKVGLTYTTLRRSLEQHRGDARSLSIRELSKIADVLNVSPSALLPAPFTRDAA